MTKLTYFLEQGLIFEEKPKSPKFQDLTGQVFGRWTVEKYAWRCGCNYFWICECGCGSKKIVQAGSLKSGDTKSCGCFSIERMTTHGNTANGKTSETYKCWKCMKSRCQNPKHKHFTDYGGRGIKICEKWQTYKWFLEDMGERPKGMTLERIDNSKGYYKENCRWATRKEQNNNKRNNHLLTFGGKTQTMTQWTEELGMNQGTLSVRIKRGWPIEKALTTPVNNYKVKSYAKFGA